MFDESCSTCVALQSSLSEYLSERAESLPTAGISKQYSGWMTLQQYDATTRQAVRRIEAVIATHVLWVHDSGL